MNSDSSERLLLLIVTASFLAIVVTIYRLFGWPGIVGVALSIVISVVIILASKAL